MPRSPTRIGTGPTTLRGVGRPGLSAWSEPITLFPAGPASLDPDPAFGAEIRETHRGLVDAAVARLGTTDPAEISADVYLPVWTVRRHLFALGLGPDPSPKVVRRQGGRSRRGGKSLT